jgi:hypothetical protein
MMCSPICPFRRDAQRSAFLVREQNATTKAQRAQRSEKELKSEISNLRCFSSLCVLCAFAVAFPASAEHPLIRSAASGAWSVPTTWENGHAPTTGDRVLIRTGHRVTYDVNSAQPLWSVHVAGTLAFAPDRDTRMDVGLLVVKAGEEDVAAEDVVDSPGHHHHADGPTPALEVGTAEHPIEAAHHALIRLTYQAGMDKDAAPALIDCGGRMDLHGAPMRRTWLKLRNPAKAGDATVALMEPATGWRVGDRVIVVSTIQPRMFTKDGQVIPSVKAGSQTEERTITAVDDQMLTLDKPLGYDHTAEGEFRGEVADLSRNVVIESANPAGVRGHTMYHRGLTGSVSYAEFRHLGKLGTLGRYSLHFHQAGDTMRGTSVVGCSIWDSANHWITVHGTNFLVVRDCVGYGASGHGFFLEDGTEEYNVFDRNLAVQALHAEPLPNQILPFDHNDGCGFWWANSLNTFTRNVAAECDQYGYRFEAGHPSQFNSTLEVRQADGSKAPVDIRTLPFIRFEDNEAHTQRRFALNLGGIRLVAGNDAYMNDANGKRVLNPQTTAIGDVDGVGPDLHHPFIVHNFLAWAVEWGYHSATPNVLVDGLTVHDSSYGIWRSRVDGLQFKNLSLSKISEHDIFVPWGGAKAYDNDVNPSLKPKDDLPPSTVITGWQTNGIGELVVRGTTTDNGTVTEVRVNGQVARAVEPNFAQWEVRLTSGEAGSSQLTALAKDAAGNVEKTPHVVTLS